MKFWSLTMQKFNHVMCPVCYFKFCKVVWRRYLGKVGKFNRTLWLIYPKHCTPISIKIGQHLMKLCTIVVWCVFMPHSVESLSDSCLCSSDVFIGLIASVLHFSVFRKNGTFDVLESVSRDAGKRDQNQIQEVPGNTGQLGTLQSVMCAVIHVNVSDCQKRH